MTAAPSPANDDTLNWAAAWDGMVQAQQRWWAEWTESGQLWASWWLSQMPPIAAVTAAQWPLAPGLTAPEHGAAPAHLLGASHTPPLPEQVAVQPQRVRAAARHR